MTGPGGPTGPARPNDFAADDDLMSFATVYALHALSDADAADIDNRLRDAPADVAEAFVAEVRAVRETMAVIASATAVEPPAHLRADVLSRIVDDPVRTLPVQAQPARSRSRRWSTPVLAGAAAVVIGLAAVGVGIALRPAQAPSAAEQIFAAPDVRTVSGEIPGGGTATVVFSREKNSGVLVMNNVAPPEPGSVYQMWLVGTDGPHSAGTMDAAAVAPSTTAVLPDLGTSQALAFTVEPPGGSTQPTTPVFAELPLI
ncbi:disfunctional anti-sigma-K factor [Mycolicibacterium aurum]|uniref:Anti-sigma-K factor RskA n=2 Tax=Mycolicibacterium aurum TaxID=1791 RepID=A0A3S4VSC9_MYCAU|nr:disfunctional anti-sigma-K factor [Mycolicibacterium aurum]